MQDKIQQNREAWKALLYKAMPFSEAVSDELPPSRLLRLSLFQVSCGMAMVLLSGTLNRVMIVELGVPAWLVALMVALPLLFAPLRAIIGFRSDHHKSAIGWRRVPYIWMGSLLQFGGLCIMPFALLLLSGDGNAPVWVAQAAAALAFLLVGVGLHTTQTAGLALATDIAPEDTRAQVVAVLYVTLLLGMVFSAIVFSLILTDFTQIKLIGAIQGAAVVTIVLNSVALWKQEARQPNVNWGVKRPPFKEAWSSYIKAANGYRFLVATVLGTAGFTMQDILLEPYGGEILNLSVSGTTALTALLAGGSLAAFAYAAFKLKRHSDPTRVAASGLLVGILAFSIVIFAEPLNSTNLFRVGTILIGFGSGLFGVSTLIFAMTNVTKEHRGLSLGAWGAAQATAAGVGVAVGGFMRDVINGLSAQGVLGEAMSGAEAGYTVVYHFEIALLFAALIAIGPLCRRGAVRPSPSQSFELSEFPNI